MERNVAIKKLQKLVGKGFAYRLNPAAPTPEERAEAKAQLPAALAELKALDEKIAERRRKLLDDPDFKALNELRKIAEKRRTRLYSAQHSHKFSVGDTSSGLFYMVRAEGDSWEEVIDKLTAKAGA